MSHALTYDNLPAHSRLRREFDDGVVRIIAAPEEPGPLVRRAALARAAVPAAMICAAVLLVAAATFGATFQLHRRYMSPLSTVVLAAAALVFFVALFALVWRAQYTARLDAAQQALGQGTVVAASKGRLVIETTGPLGNNSYDLGSTIRGFRIGWYESSRPVDCLQVVLTDGTAITLLAGRDEVELRWVARTLRNLVGGADHRAGS